MNSQEDPKKKKKKRKGPGLVGSVFMRKKLQTYVPGKVDAVLQMEAEMNISSRFVIMKHEAKRAGLHYDLRFKMPKSKNWISFSIRKGIPSGTEKRLAVRTNDHSEKEALFVGTIGDGYGAGRLTKFDSGSCKIIKYNPPRSMAVEFQGSKLKGLYHFINIGVMKRKDFKKQNYWFFKGKQLKEAIEKIIGG